MAVQHLLSVWFFFLSVASVVSAAAIVGEGVDGSRFRIRRQNYIQNITSHSLADTVSPERLSPTIVSTSSSFTTSTNGANYVSIATTAPVLVGPPRASTDQPTLTFVSDINSNSSLSLGTSASNPSASNPATNVVSRSLTDSSLETIRPSIKLNLSTGPPLESLIPGRSGYLPGLPKYTSIGTRPGFPLESLVPESSGYLPGFPKYTSVGTRPGFSLNTIVPKPSGYLPGTPSKIPIGTGLGGQSNCSGTLTVDPNSTTVIILATTTITNYTITIPTGAPSPEPELIFPPPPCYTESTENPQNLTSGGGKFRPALKPHIIKIIPALATFGGPVPTETPAVILPFALTSTQLVTLKSPVVVVSGSSVPELFENTPPAPILAGAPINTKTAAKGNAEPTPIGGSVPAPANPGKLIAPAPASKPKINSPTPAPVGGQSNPQSNPQPAGNGSPGNGQSNSPTNPQPAGNGSPGNGQSNSPSNPQPPANGEASPPIAGNPAPDSGEKPKQDVNGEAPGVFTVGNVPVTVGPAGVVVNSQTIPAGASRTAVVVNGKSIVVEPSRIVFPETTIPLIVNQPAPAKSVTIGNVPVVLQPGQVVVGSRTFTPGASPTTIVDHGQTFELGSSQFSSPKTTIALPKAGAPTVATAGLVTAGGQVFHVGLSQVQAPGLTVPLPTGSTSSSFVYNGQTYKVNPSQIIAPDRTIDLPHAQQAPSHAVFVYNGQTLSIDDSKFVAPSTTIALPGASGTIVYNGQTLAIGPSQVAGPSTTIQLLQTPEADITAAPSAITVAGRTFSLGPSAAIVGSITYSFLPGQAPTTIVDHGQTISLGPNGVGIDGTTIPIPTPPPHFSPVTAGGLTFSVAPSEAVVGGHTFTVGAGIAPITTVVNGQTISIGPQGIGLATTTIAIPSSEPSFSTVTAGGLTFSVAASEAVIGSHTFTIGPDSAPTTTVINGQTISIGPQGIGLATTTVALPSAEPSFSTVTAGGLIFSVAASEAVIAGHTFTIGSGITPITTVINGQTISIGPQGIGLATTTVALPSAEPSFSTVTAGGLTFSVAASEAVIAGHTFTIGSGITPITTVINGQTISIGPHGIGLATTTVALPPAQSSFSVVTQGDLTLSLSPSEAVIDGKTFTIGPGSVPITTVIDGETLTIGPSGVGIAGTTAALPSVTGAQTPSAVTVDGLTFSVEPTDVIIGGTTYPIGIGATPTTIVIGNETISIGPGGIGLPSTTIPVPPGASSTGSTGSTTHSGAVSQTSTLTGLLMSIFLASFVLLLVWM